MRLSALTSFVMLALCLFTSSLSSIPARADPAGGNLLHKFYLGVGVFAYSFGSYSTDVTGKSRYQALVFQEFSFASRFELARFPQWAVVPLVAFTPFGRKSSDGNEVTRIVRFAGRGVYGLPVGPATIDFFGGLGVLNSIVSGSGGTVRLNNGNGFSEFGVPSDSSTTNLFYWEAGAGAQIAAIRWDNSILVTGMLSSRRAWSLSSQLSFGVF